MSDRVATSAFYSISAIVTVFILDESNPAILERRKVMKNLKELNLPPEEYEEQKRQIMFQLNVQRSGDCGCSSVEEGNQSHAASAKWKFNYVMVIALIGEFCSRWIVNIFDVSFAAFGEERFQISSFEFSMASAMGSFINIFQTGWLFNVFLKHDISIPVISSFGGISGGRRCSDWYSLIGSYDEQVCCARRKLVFPCRLWFCGSDGSHGYDGILAEIVICRRSFRPACRELQARWYCWEDNLHTLWRHQHWEDYIPWEWSFPFTSVYSHVRVGSECECRVGTLRGDDRAELHPGWTNGRTGAAALRDGESGEGGETGVVG